MTDLLDFYRQHGISPVSQDISDLPKHFARRAALFRHLGILPQAVRAAEVLEVGPGGGHNALYTLSLNPRTLCLVEPNPTGFGQCVDRFHDNHSVLVIQSDLEHYGFVGRPFDFVFCEGMLSGHANPRAVLDKLIECTAIGGVLTVTCVDVIGHFPEIIRRAQAQAAIDPSAPLADQVAVLRPMFAPHLATLPNMSRPVDDWIIDNLINPGSILPQISFAEIIEHVWNKCRFWGCSPRFVQENKWYKDCAENPGDKYGVNALAYTEYLRKCHNFVDHRFWNGERSIWANKELHRLCTEARDQLAAFEVTRDQRHLTAFNLMAEKIAPDFEPGMFGRAQLYLTMVRTA